MLKRLVLAVAAGAAVPLAIHAAPRPQLEVRAPWSRPAAAGTNGVGYMVLINRGGAPAVLLGARSPVAAKVEMHSSSMVGGMMSMKAEARIVIPPHGRVTFAPGGDHLMFTGLKRALKPGGRLAAELRFADGARLKVMFPVGAGFGPPHAPVTGM